MTSVYRDFDDVDDKDNVDFNFDLDGYNDDVYNDDGCFGDNGADDND